jgi:hypothetical protein
MISNSTNLIIDISKMISNNFFNNLTKFTNEKFYQQFESDFNRKRKNFY